MPEGHTIHRIARDHRVWFSGQTISLTSPQGRFGAEARTLDGCRLQDVTARGKHLFYHWSPQEIVHIHLGLYGKFRIHKNPAPEPRGAVRVRMVGQERSFDLNGPTCCELIDAEKFVAIKNRLGQDPLCKDACPETLWQRMSRSRSAIGTLLLNQSVIAGVGNIYRAEILFLLGIHPETPANQLSREQFDCLWELTGNLLKTGVKYNRIITVDPGLFNKPLSKLKSSERLCVYKQSNCRNCNTKIEDWLLGNRKIFACSKCQKMRS
ncbi:Fpg/Nei family DNA glycosylase [Rubripirellula reticaptiva]|uniref:DNA-(apurinic or apyrimidinic site) lyase n=1 Tax=Rubripirellula reticaptiva TaxID=2528013 RepID=A0A5C6F986_9BACT|nr:DNA-formamidopyrimidine glycosylase family protein [Rubripirellula reticaptiva]TWU56269.1 Endonuclease 8 1 [Rubripirellula reticaptiva]